jgi:hypothetical protein
MSEAVSLLPEDPRRIGSYELRGRLGQGGQGVVYLGVGASGEQVAVKLLHASLRDDDPARARFVRELATARRVARFCTAQVLDADIHGDRPFIVSEYVEGPSLAEVIADRGPIEGAQLERIAIGTATALAAIHQADIVHRDFKPANVLLGPDGPRVIDFGVAKALDPAATGASAVVGTPSYMAPEQFGGQRVGTPADVWAWGATIAFAATGRAPFGSDTIPAVMGRILQGAPDIRGVPEPLRDLVAAALTRDPAARPASAELLMRLIGHGGETTQMLHEGRTIAAATRPDLPPATRVAAPPPMPTTAAPPSDTGGGNRWLVPAMISVVAVLVAVGAVFWALTRDTGGTPVADDSGTPGGTATGTPSSAAASTTDAPAADGARLTVSPVGDVRVQRQGGTVEVTLSAEGGDVEWTSSASGVTVSRSFGTIRDGRNVRVTVTLTDPNSGYVTFESEGTPDQTVRMYPN